MKGWSEDISNITSYDELPENAKKYIEEIERLTNTKVATVSVGPDRSQTINRIELL